MTEEELDQFISGREVYNTVENASGIIHSVDNSADRINIEDKDSPFMRSITLHRFQKEWIFTDELFGAGRHIKKHLLCECGVDKLGYGKHSAYCPKHGVDK